MSQTLGELRRWGGGPGMTAGDWVPHLEQATEDSEFELITWLVIKEAKA